MDVSNINNGTYHCSNSPTELSDSQDRILPGNYFIFLMEINKLELTKNKAAPRKRAYHIVIAN